VDGLSPGGSAIGGANDGSPLFGSHQYGSTSTNPNQVERKGNTRCGRAVVGDTIIVVRNGGAVTVDGGDGREGPGCGGPVVGPCGRDPPDALVWAITGSGGLLIAKAASKTVHHRHIATTVALLGAEIDRRDEGERRGPYDSLNISEVFRVFQRKFRTSRVTPAYCQLSLANCTWKANKSVPRGEDIECLETPHFG
jgi:hypothetical protein